MKNDFSLFVLVLAVYVLFGLLILYLKNKLKINPLAAIAAVLISFIAGVALLLYAIGQL